MECATVQVAEPHCSRLLFQSVTRKEGLARATGSRHSHAGPGLDSVFTFFATHTKLDTEVLPMKFSLLRCSNRAKAMRMILLQAAALLLRWCLETVTSMS